MARAARTDRVQRGVGGMAWKLKTVWAMATAIVIVAQPLQAETLADAMAYGYEASGLLEQNRALLRVADEDVAQAVGALLPVVNWIASADATYPSSPFATDTIGNTELSASIGLSASLLLYDGGVSRLAIDVQKENVLATRQGLLAVEQEVLFRIVEAYVDLQSATEFVQLRQNNVRLITEQLRAAQDRFEVGEVTRTDVAQAEARLASAQTELAVEQGILFRAVEEFRAAVGRAPGDLAVTAPVTIDRSLAEARAIALRNHPALLQAQFNVTAAELNVLRAEAAMNPTLSLSARVGLDDEWNDSAGVGLDLSGPIYQGGRLSSQVRQFIARRDAARASLLVTAQSIEQNVGNAYSFLEVARANITATAEGVRAARVAFEGIREEATLGARTTLDVLDAEQELLDARANQIRAQYEETKASYALLATMGLLTAENLNLRVQIYDPTAYYNLVDDAPAVLSPQGQALDRVLQSIGAD
jgi:outer membrane protein